MKMEEYKGRINVSKDTMIFVTNYALGNEIKEWIYVKFLDTFFENFFIF